MTNRKVLASPGFRGRIPRILMVLAAVALIAYLTTAYSSIDEGVRAILGGWAQGNPVVVLSLEVKAPGVDADSCFIAVHRFPTMYNPIPGGWTERLYAGIVDPGDRVRVELELQGIPVSYTLDEDEGRYKIRYYEPQEFYILAACLKDGEIVYTAGRIVEVYPDSIAYRKVVNLGRLEGQSHYTQPPACEGPDCASLAGKAAPCTLQPENGKSTCHTLVAGPMLYSLKGLNVSYGIAAYPRASTVYLEGLYSIDLCGPEGCANPASWQHGGRKRVSSAVTAETQPLEGDIMVRIYFGVVYKYEVHEYQLTGGRMIQYRLLYPHALTGVYRADSITEFGAGGVEPYSPPDPPPHAGYKIRGSVTIAFSPPREETPWGTGIWGASSWIAVNSSEGWDALLSTGYYEYVRWDQQYSTPYVSIKGDEGREYYWWFKNNDPATLEVQLGE